MSEQEVGFIVYLGLFSKHENSTKQATYEDWDKVTHCVIKQGMDILSPVIGFNFGRLELNKPTEYNYARIPVFARFYYIKNWEWRDGLWWAYMQVDVMASYKDQIGAQEMYIERASKEYNSSISDGFYPTLPETVLSKTPFSSPWVSSLLSGTYVVGVISGDSGAHGAVAYYAMSSNAMAYLRQQLFSTTAYMGQIQDISTDLLKALVDPFQYITSAMWFPCDPGGTIVSTMSIGWWDVDMTGKGVKRVENFIYLTSSRSISVKANPTAISQGGDYRYSSPYSSYSVFLPPFGEIVLSASVLSNFIFDAPQIAVPSCTVNYQVAVDVITGLGHVIFTIDTAGSDNIIIAEAESQVGVPTSIAQNSGTSIQAVAGYVGKTLGGDSMLYAGLGALATKMVNTAFPVLSASGAFEPTVKSKFDNGALVKYQMACYIQTQYRPTVDENIDKFGRPLYATRTINTLGKTQYASGYIKTINADVDIAGATITEQESIKEIMDGGFFYE